MGRLDELMRIAGELVISRFHFDETLRAAEQCLTPSGLRTLQEINTLMERAILAAFPDEVEHAWSRIGTAEVATDPMGVELTDLFITLKPRQRWQKARTQDQLRSTINVPIRAPATITRIARRRSLCSAPR